MEHTHRGRFAIADTLRLVAIVAVVIGHLTRRIEPTFFAGKNFNFDCLGIWGVAAFFVLSGYLLSKPYLRYVLHDGAWPSTKLYLTRRFLRIVPLYWFALAFSVAVMQLLGLPSRFWDIVAHATMMQDFFVTTVQTINPPFWTMPVDVEFYLALPALAYCAARIVRAFAIDERPKILALLFASAIAASIAYRIAIQHALPMPGVEKFVYLDNGFGIAFAFLVGAALEWIQSGVRPTKNLVYGSIACALILYAVVAKTQTLRDASLVLSAVAAALLLFALPYVRPVLSFSQRRSVAVCASFAYAIYLFHFPVMELTYASLHSHHGNASFIALGAITLAFLLPIAYLAHRFIERPFLLLKDRKRESATEANREIARVAD